MKKILVLIALILGLASCGNAGNNTDIINPDAEYLYFFGATCPHCQELNKQVKDQDLFSQIEVEKREVYFNEENREKFNALAKELELDPARTGVPFVYDTISGEHAIGVDNAMTLFKNRLGEITSEDNSEPETNEETTDTSAE